MSVTPSPSVGNPNDVSSPSDVDFFRSDSTLEDVEADPQVSAAPCQHQFDPYNQTTFPVSRPRPRQPGETSLRSPSQKLNTGLSSASWVGPLASPSANSFSGNSLRSTSRLAFEEDQPPTKKSGMKKVYIIAAAAGIAIALATIIALVVTFGTKNNDGGESDDTDNRNLGGANSQSGDSSGSTTQNPSIVIEDPVIIIYAGSWGNWSEYSVCPVTCGGGYRTRIRECLSEPCVGTSTQSESCNTDRCPPSVIYGTWATWSDWNGCGKSCGGGTEFRDRLCVKQSEEDEDCVGNPYQSRTCNEFECPDCNKICENGTLSSDCTHCECGENLYGRVLSGGILLSGATISPIETPTAAISQTGADGMLNLTDQCMGVNYIIQKDGYISVEISTSNLGTDSIKIIDMAELEHLSIVMHPQDRMRLVGESVTLCCESSGNPPANDYEWLKDGNIVATTSGGSSSTLEFSSLTVDQAGYYSCRANNDYGAILSSDAHINVKESANEFCVVTPQTKIIELPDGCAVDGDVYFDVGECSPVACRGGDPDNGTCADDQDNAYCCGPLVYSVVEIPCEDDDGEFTLPVNIAKECGCVLCPEPQLSVAGIAYGNETMLQQGDIVWNGTVIAQTTQNGTFEFNVPVGTERISLLFKDTVNRILLDTVYVVDFPRGAEGMYYITVLMLASAVTVEVDSTQAATIDLPSVGNTSEPIATVSIPANSFVNADGEPYEGSVTISVGVVDPEDLTSLESAAGDFSAVGENGETLQLESSGMMSFGFTDADGNPLAVSASVEIEVPTDDENVVLWEMDPNTGRWVESGQLSPSRKKSSGGASKLNGIKYTQTWYNFDKIRDYACYSKVRVYETEDFYEDEQVPGVQVSVIVKTKKKGKRKGTKSLSRVRPYSEERDKNGYCVIHPCASYRGDTDYEFEGWIMAHKDGVSLRPLDISDPSLAAKSGLDTAIQDYGITGLRNKYHIEVIHLDSAFTYGPFYDWTYSWSYSPMCSYAPSSDRHFRFSANMCYKEFDLIKYTTKAKENCIDDYFLLWNGLPSLEVISIPYRVAFIKVFTPGIFDLKVIAKTKVKNQRTASNKGKRNTLIGSRRDCIDNYYQIVCLEFKPPSEIGCSLSNIVNETGYILIVRAKGGLRVAEVNSELMALAGDSIKRGAGKKSFKMELDDLPYGPEHGLYYAEHTDRDIAKRMAKQMCLAGTADIGNSREITSDNWAVTFNGCKDETNIVFAISYIHSHFSPANMRRVIDRLSTIASAVVSGNVRIALIDVMAEENHLDTVIWDLNSAISNWGNISTYIEDAVREEFYEYDHLYYEWDCYYDHYWNHSIAHYAKQVLEQANNFEDSNNIVVFIGDELFCHWCYCYDYEMEDVMKYLSTNARLLRIQSYPSNYDYWDHYYGNTNWINTENKFSFNQTEAVIDRIQTYGCLLD